MTPTSRRSKETARSCMRERSASVDDLSTAERVSQRDDDRAQVADEIAPSRPIGVACADREEHGSRVLPSRVTDDRVVASDNGGHDDRSRIICPW